VAHRKAPEGNDIGKLGLTRRIWRARWLYVSCAAGGLVLLFLFRGGDLAGWLPSGDAEAETPAATVQSELATREAATESGRHRSRQVRQRDDVTDSRRAVSIPAPSQITSPGSTAVRDTAAADAETSSPRSAAAGSDADEQDDPPGLEISGTVLDGAGVPLPGIRVQGRALAAYLADPGSTGTNALGMFSFHSLEPGEYVLSVAESDEHHAATVQVRAGSIAVELYLQAKGEVEVQGLVEDEAGQPLPGVAVRLLGTGETRTGPDGNYHLAGPWGKAGQAPVVEFRHPEYLVKRQSVSVPSVRAGSQVVRLDVRLERREASATLGGRLTGPAGESVASARVWLSSSSPPVHRQAITDSAGFFLMERLEPGGHFLLGVTPPEGYASWVSEPMAIVAGNNRRDIEVGRNDRGALFGAVIDPHGRPLANFALWARSITPAGQMAVPVVTDSVGQFWLPDVAVGTMQIETRSLPRLEARGIRIEARRDNQVIVPLDWGDQWLFGQVVDTNGRPLAGASVSLQWGVQYLDLYSTSVRQARSDIDGQFVFSNLGADHYALVARADGHVSARVQHVPVGPFSDEVKVVLEQANVGGGGGR
jgi:protocatechuate 3,4-dioxygenase beta subunit